MDKNIGFFPPPNFSLPKNNTPHGGTLCYCNVPREYLLIKGVVSPSLVKWYCAKYMC